MPRMLLTCVCRDLMIERARIDSPNETCGFFSGRPGRIEEIHPMRNVSAEPVVRYEFDPTEHFKMLKQMDRAGIPILGVYHSHPASPAYPSATDVGRAILPDGAPTYSEYLYIILSLETPAAPVLRGFRILPYGKIQEEELAVEDARA